MPKIRELSRTDFDLDKKFYTTKELAELLGVSGRFLEILRTKGTGPRYVGISTRKVKYPAHEVEKFLADRLVSSTSETPAYKIARERRAS